MRVMHDWFGACCLQVILGGYLYNHHFMNVIINGTMLYQYVVCRGYSLFYASNHYTTKHHLCCTDYKSLKFWVLVITPGTTETLNDWLLFVLCRSLTLQSLFSTYGNSIILCRKHCVCASWLLATGYLVVCTTVSARSEEWQVSDHSVLRIMIYTSVYKGALHTHLQHTKTQ